jgi:hypothetical protein
VVIRIFIPSLPRALIRYFHLVVARHFLQVWLVALLLVVAVGIFLCAYGDPAASFFSSGAARLRRKSNWHFSLADRLAAVLFALFLAVYVAMVFYKADFATYDDSEVFTDYSVRGIPYPPPIWIAAGRFFPLAYQEFNVVSRVTRSIAGYETVAVVQLLILLVAFYFSLQKVQIRFRFLILAAVMLTPSFVIPFTGLIFPERNILFWLAILLLCLNQYFKTKACWYFIAALVVTHFVLYYKETVVVFVVVFAISRALLEFTTNQQHSQRSFQEVVKDNALSLGMLAVAGIYATLFFVALLPRGTPAYVIQQHGRFEGLGVASTTPLLLWQLLTDWMPLVLLVVFIARLAWCILSRGELDTFLDPLAVGAVAYYFCIITLRIGNGWYMAPVDFISVFYLARLSAGWLRRRSTVRVCAVVIVFLSIVVHDALYSSFLIVERKSVITAKARFADFLRGYLATAKGDTVELFFPDAYGYDLMGLSAYLRNQGIQLDGSFADSQANGGSVGTRIVIQGSKEFADNKCVPYRDYVCHHAESARPGSLIVVLPDDNISITDMERVGRNATPLLDWRAPDFCTRKGSFFRSLHAMSRTYPRTRLPEHWLQLQVLQAELRDADP